MWNPVISTKCGGPESFLNDRTGILIDIDNKKQLTTAMESMITTMINMNLKS